MRPLLIASALASTLILAASTALADVKGQHVVLEWINPGRPYVVKHDGSANMQGTQREAAAKGVVWLSVNSTAVDHGDDKAPAAMAQWMQGHQPHGNATLRLRRQVVVVDVS